MIEQLTKESTLKIKLLKTLEIELEKMASSNETQDSKISFSKDELLKIVETSFPDDQNLK
jgi:hypothetical protein